MGQKAEPRIQAGFGAQLRAHFLFSRINFQDTLARGLEIFFHRILTRRLAYDMIFGGGNLIAVALDNSFEEWPGNSGRSLDFWFASENQPNKLTLGRLSSAACASGASAMEVAAVSS